MLLPFFSLLSALYYIFLHSKSRKRKPFYFFFPEIYLWIRIENTLIITRSTAESQNAGDPGFSIFAPNIVARITHGNVPSIPPSIYTSNGIFTAPRKRLTASPGKKFSVLIKKEIYSGLPF